MQKEFSNIHYDKNFCYKLRVNFTHLKLNIKIYEIIFGDTNILKALLEIHFFFFN